MSHACMIICAAGLIDRESMMRRIAIKPTAGTESTRLSVEYNPVSRHSFAFIVISCLGSA